MLDRLIRGLEKRSAPAAVYPRPGTITPFGFLRGNTTGASVTVDTAMELVPVYGAVAMLAGAIGSLPLKVYRDTEPRMEAAGSRQWRLLHDQPNDEMAADEFWEITATSLLLWGNAFLFKERDQNGVVQALWPIRPNRVMVGRKTLNGVSTRYFQLDSSPDLAYETDILHLRGLSTDGLVGLSPVQQARQQLANDQAHQEFLGTFLKNGMFSTLVFTHPNRLTKEASERLKDDIADRSGWLEAGRIPILEEGADLKNLSMPLEDAQFVEQAGLSDHRIAQLFGLVPPHQWGIGSGNGSMTYQNSEFGGLEFVKWSVRKWLVRIENSLKRDPGLFPAPGPVLFPEFIVDALLRSDTKTRYEAYQIAIDAGFMSVGQVQEMENIEPDDTQLAGIPQPEPTVMPSALPMAPNGGTPAMNGRSATEALPAPHTTSLAVLDDLRSIFRPEIRVDIPQTIVHVEPQRQLPPDVIVTAPDMTPIAAALDRLTEAVAGKELSVTVEAPTVTVNQPVTPVQLTLLEESDAPINLNVDFQRNPNGTIKSATVTED